MVYGGQRDGVRGRPVRKHRVYTGPRTVTGSPPPRRVVECGGGCALVAYLSLGLELLGRVARVVFAYASQVTDFTLVSFLLRRRVFLARKFGCFGENETKVRAARLHCRRARVLHAAPGDASAHERRRRRHYPHANRGVQASDNRVTFRRAAGTGDHRGEHLHVQDASIACYALICIGTARCL